MNGVLAWFRDNRTSARAAFVLRTCTLVVNAFMALLWTRWMLHAFGKETYGTYAAFLGFLGLASAGEFGMGGAVSIRTNQLLAAGKLEELRRLHGTARRLFLLVALLLGSIALALAPLLPAWLGFRETAAAGPLSLLFATGAVSIAMNIYGSYWANASYGAGSVLWPVLPGFLTAQLISALQVTLGFAHQPLWVVQAATTAAGALSLAAAWLIHHHSHPVFAERLPYPREPLLRELAATSIWSYLFALATLVYISTDRLIVNAFLGAATVPVLLFNGKLGELAITLVVTAGGVAMPKIVTRMLSEQTEQRAAGHRDGWKLARMQSFLGVAFALGYLWVNRWFVGHLYGPSLLGSDSLEGAVAVSLILGSNLDIYTQFTTRLHADGLRYAGTCVLLSAVMNFGLSLSRRHSFTGSRECSGRRVWPGLPARGLCPLRPAANRLAPDSPSS